MRRTRNVTTRGAQWTILLPDNDRHTPFTGSAGTGRRWTSHRSSRRPASTIAAPAGHRRRDRTADLGRRAAARRPPADRSRAVHGARGVAHHGQRGVADPRRRRGDRRPRPPGHLRPPADRDRAHRGATDASPRAPATSRSTCRTGTPDPALLPDLGPVHRPGQPPVAHGSYLDQPVLPALDERLRADWPFPPEELTVVDGAMDALDRVAQVVVRLGDRVVVEHPTFPPLLDLLDLLGAEVDRRRPRRRGHACPTQLAAALDQRPVAVFLPAPRPQPDRRHDVATRPRCSPSWPRTARRQPTPIVVEDDHSGDIASGTLVSLGHWLPDAHRAHPQLLQEPRPRPAPRRGRRCRRRGRRAVANRRLLGPGLEQPHPAGRAARDARRPRPRIDAVAAARDEYAPPAPAVADVLDAARRAVHRHRRHQPVDAGAPTSARRCSRWRRRASAPRRASRSWCAPTQPHIRVTVGPGAHHRTAPRRPSGRRGEPPPHRAGQR